ncbi:hypothetical protein EV356DRAFT_543004 [Viridothelium virens]|uniref:Tat pathway signal sequence n=1 Tax=Viridothelium virens TaxID=1048519 RepID=A0A6A6HDQ5_VIRVR|nr:hypothetical protein EV356DRAFT_543004 [Viridothelium virens]
MRLGYSANIVRTAPAQEAISYHKVNFNSDLFYSSRFRGPPRPELDATWHDLLENSNIRLSSEELRRLGKSSVALADGSGYYGALNVHHHLHCLKSVRQYAHQEYYNITNADKEEHLDHCLDDIRQALMCHADISVFTYDWIPSYRKPLPNFKVAHECVDWELLGNWTRERSFSLYDQKSLIHPDLGVSFPKANGPVEANAWNLDRRLIFPDKVH